MFETETNCIDERREDAPEAPVRTPAESARVFFAGFFSGLLLQPPVLFCGPGKKRSRPRAAS